MGVCAYELACVCVHLKIKCKIVVFQRTVIKNENQYKFVCLYNSARLGVLAA